MATPYYGWILPTVGASADVWGGLLNAVITAQDTQLASPANTFKGNNTGSTAASINLTVAQATAMLNPVVGDSGSGGTKGLVPAPAAGDAAANKYLSAAGSWVALPPVELKAFGSVVGSSGAVTGRGATVSRLATGTYRVTFSTPLSNDDYVVTTGVYASIRATVRVDIGTKTAATFDLVVENSAGGVIDPVEVFFQVVAV